MTKAVTRNWHQYRTVTKNLPLRNKYDPLFTGTNAICYLVDSGVNIDHVMLTGSVFEQLHSHDGAFEDKHGHGTAIASLVNSVELGISPGATIKIVDMITEKNDVDQSRVIEALNAVLDDHLKTSDVTKVVLLPWIVALDPIIDAKVKELYENNLVVVCAAGQKGNDVAGYSPAGLDFTVTVGATDHFDRAYDADHPWTKSHMASNHGQAVSIFAPGGEITTADINGFVTTITGPSTSASSAIVAGICLNIISNDATLTSAEVIEKLYSSAISDIVYFVDETKYNAHNNRLAYQENKHYREVWADRGQLAEVQSSTGVHEVNLNVALDIVESENYAHTPAFVRIEGKKLIIDSDAAVEPGKYQFILSAKDAENKFNRNFYIDILDSNGKLPTDKEYFTEVNDAGVSSTTNYLEFQGGVAIFIK